jgi:hypothetical protein
MTDKFLADWVNAEKLRLDRFAEWWRGEQKRQPDSFPAKMPDGEWDEQYRGWVDYLVSDEK